MATKPKSTTESEAEENGPQIPEFEEDALYAVRFSRVVWDGPFQYFPRDVTQFRGAVVKRIIEKEGPDVITSVEPR